MPSARVDLGQPSLEEALLRGVGDYWSPSDAPRRAAHRASIVRDTADARARGAHVAQCGAPALPGRRSWQSEESL
jgi:hypothetical protein